MFCVLLLRSNFGAERAAETLRAMPDVGYPSRVRETVSKGRSGGNGDFETDPLRNLAYVVSSANDNITALQRTVKQQEKDLCTKTDQIASLQRNYETLSRIRQADQSEFMLLKGLHEEQQAALAEAHVALAAERERVGELRAELSAGEQDRAELPELRARAAELMRGKAEAEAAAEVERARAAEQSEATKRLHLQVEKLGRAQAETLARASKMDETCARLQQEKAAAEQGRVSAGSKLAVQERQLRTFLEANEVKRAQRGPLPSLCLPPRSAPSPSPLPRPQTTRALPGRGAVLWLAWRGVAMRGGLRSGWGGCRGKWGSEVVVPSVGSLA